MNTNKIVIDSSVAIKWFIPQNYSFEANKILSADDLLRDAYDFAVKYQRSVYDSLYVVLSLRENCRFVSADEKLYNAIHQDIFNIKLLKNWENS